MYDLAIIGAGPSGSTLARLIGKEYRVLLIDKRKMLELPEKVSSSKCCGGLLVPDAQAMLSKLGLGLPKSVLVEPQLFVVRSIDFQQNIEKFYQRFYINMNRHKFDIWLLSLLPDCVDLRLGCEFRYFIKEKDCFILKLKNRGQSFIEKSRIIVGADGSASRVRYLLNNSKPFPKSYIAVQEWVRSEKKMPYFSSVFDSELTDFYGWTIPKEDYLIIGIALQPRDRTVYKFNIFKQKLVDYGFNIGKTYKREGALISRPLNINQLSTGSKGVALIGEAAGFISPSSAEGLSYAFKTALMLSETLDKRQFRFEKLYRSRGRKLAVNILFKNLKSKFIFNPVLRKIIMKTGFNSLDVIKQ